MHRSALSVILLKKLYFKSVMHRSALSVFLKKMLRIPELTTPSFTLCETYTICPINPANYRQGLL